MVKPVRHWLACAGLSVGVSAGVAVAGMEWRDLPVELRLSSSLYVPRVTIDITVPATIATLGTGTREALDHSCAVYFVAEPNDHSLEMASWSIGCRVVEIPDWDRMFPDRDYTLANREETI